MTDPYETVIIGGGIAGLACARELHDNGRTFLLITEDVGGRVRRSADGGVNLGAYYVRDDYAHVNRFVDRGRRIRRFDIQRVDRDGSISRGDRPLVKHPVQAMRFFWHMRAFRRRYDVFKLQCGRMSQADAIRSDPMLWQLYTEPAVSWIRRTRIDDLARTYLAHVVQGTGFTSVEGLSAFTLLVGLLPAVVPSFEFELRLDLLADGFSDAVREDSVIGISSSEGRHVVHCMSGGTFAADSVVVATPIHISARLLDLDTIKGPIEAHMFVVRGELRRPWARTAYTLFPEGHEVLSIAMQGGGTTLFCSTSGDPDFEEYFTSWDVIDHVHWNPAFNIEGTVLLDCQQRPGLYLVGDHNVCDLEDAYITGLHAARRILEGAVPV